jgi:hypothetical protein
MEAQVENFAMRQFFIQNDIEFTITREGNSFTANARHKGDDNDSDERTLN